jgi:hypothetical protein
MAAAAGAGIAVMAVIVYYAGLLQPTGDAFTAGDFKIHVIEDTGSRFLARLENNGPALSNAAAFAVKKGLNDNCEPQGIVVSNFQVRNEEGRLVPNPDSIPGNASVTLDSRQSNLSVIPTGPDFETAVYVLGLEPGSIRANKLIQKIPIQQPNSTELELFESCQQAYGGYPLQLKLLNPRPDMQVFVTVFDQSASYETALDIRPDAPALSELFWPPSRNDWLTANYTLPSGPVPAWQDIERVQVSVSVVSRGHVSMFEGSATPQLAAASLDFFEVAKSDPLPSYPRYWEIEVDLAKGTVG